MSTWLKRCGSWQASGVPKGLDENLALGLPEVTGRHCYIFPMKFRVLENSVIFLLSLDFFRQLRVHMTPDASIIWGSFGILGESIPGEGSGRSSTPRDQSETRFKFGVLSINTQWWPSGSGYPLPHLKIQMENIKTSDNFPVAPGNKCTWYYMNLAY